MGWLKNIVNNIEQTNRIVNSHSNGSGSESGGGGGDKNHKHVEKDKNGNIDTSQLSGPLASLAGRKDFDYIGSDEYGIHYFNDIKTGTTLVWQGSPTDSAIQSKIDESRRDFGITDSDGKTDTDGGDSDDSPYNPYY